MNTFFMGKICYFEIYKKPFGYATSPEVCNLKEGRVCSNEHRKRLKYS